MQNGSILDDDNYSNQTRELAGFWVRFGASLLDSLFLIPLTAIGFLSFVYAKDFYLYAFLTLVTFIYKPVMEGVWGATLGKMVCKLKVTDVEFKKLSFSKAFIRSIPWLFASLSGLLEQYPLFSLDDFVNADGYLETLVVQSREKPRSIVYVFQVVLLLSGLFISLKPRRGLHDYIAGSICVFKKKN